MFSQVIKPAQVEEFFETCLNPEYVVTAQKNSTATTSTTSTTSTTTTTVEMFVQKVGKLLKRNPALIDTIDNKRKGYNVLHMVLSNAAVSNNFALIELLVKTSLSAEKQKLSKQRKLKSKKNTATTNDNNNPTNILARASSVHGLLPLHIACQYASFTSLNIFEYLINSYPAACLVQDKINLNLPLHNLCMACTENLVPLEFVVILAQQWPVACQIRNRDGDLPLHLAVRMHDAFKMSASPLVAAYESFFDGMDVDTLNDLEFANDEDSSEFSDDGNSDFNHSNQNKLYDSSIRFGVIGILNNCPLASSYSFLRKESHEHTRREYQRYQNQLDIIHYLVDLFPGALHATNKKGLTPLQVAINSSPSNFPFKMMPSGVDPEHAIGLEQNPQCGSTSDDSFFNEFNERRNPIVEFLRHSSL